MPASKPPAAHPSVVEAVETSIEAARKAQQLLPQDEAAIAALRSLARTIEAMGDVDAGVSGDGELVEERKAAPKLDNVTIPTFLKFCDALGLTPAGRKALAAGKPEGGGAGVGKSKLSILRDQAAG